MRIVVHGTPAPQGSKKFVGMRAGHAVLVESSEKVGPWRKAVVAAASNAIIIEAAIAPGGFKAFSGPLRVYMTFYLVRPKNHYRVGKFAHLLRDASPVHPTVYPDVSKLARSTEDALTDAGVWLDDAQVVAYAILDKRYATTENMPGAVITIEKY